MAFWSPIRATPPTRLFSNLVQANVITHDLDENNNWQPDFEALNGTTRPEQR